MKKLFTLSLLALFFIRCSDDSNESTSNPSPVVNPMEFEIRTDYIDLRMMKVVLGKNKSGIGVNTNPVNTGLDVHSLKVNLSDYNLDNVEEVYITTKDQGNQMPIGKIRTFGTPTGTHEFTFDGTQTIQIILPLTISE